MIPTPDLLASIQRDGSVMAPGVAWDTKGEGPIAPGGRPPPGRSRPTSRLSVSTASWPAGAGDGEGDEAGAWRGGGALSEGTSPSEGAADAATAFGWTPAGGAAGAVGAVARGADIAETGPGALVALVQERRRLVASRGAGAGAGADDNSSTGADADGSGDKAAGPGAGSGAGAAASGAGSGGGAGRDRTSKACALS